MAFGWKVELVRDGGTWYASQHLLSHFGSSDRAAAFDVLELVFIPPATQRTLYKGIRSGRISGEEKPVGAGLRGLGSGRFHCG